MALIITALSGTRAHSSRSTADPAVRRLVIAADGLSWEAFILARERGLFARFKGASRHIAPYPSMSHPSWVEVVGTRRAFGARGNSRTIEARSFDLSAMRMTDDPREVIARQTSPYAYQRAWDYFFDPLTEPLQYLPGERLFDRELAEAESNILEHFTGEHYVAYVGGLDAMAHTHKDELWTYLEKFDAMLERVADSLRARGTPAEFWLVSDHGNVGDFAEGQPERYLRTVSIDGAIRRAGLVRVDTARLRRDNEVSVATIALSTMFSVYFADLSRRRDLARAVVGERGVDLVTWYEVSERDRFVVILDDSGEARLRWTDSTYSYERVTGNPLRMPDALSSAPGRLRWFSDSAMRAGTAWGPYPDAPFRIAQSAMKQVENAPDLIVSLEDGFSNDGDMGRYAKMVRTHGSLSARSSVGILATTARALPAHVRGEEVLGIIGLTPEQVLDRVADLYARRPLALAESLALGDGLVATARGMDSYDMRFLRRARPVALSMHYFSWDAIHVLLDAMRSEGKTSRIADTRSLLKRVDVVEGVSSNVDPLVAMVDSIDWTKPSAAQRRIEDGLGDIPELAAIADVSRLWSRGEKSRGSAAPLRRAAMALWTLPYYLDAALLAPEWDSIPDTRDVGFALRWHGGLREKVAGDPERLVEDTTLAPRLFGQVFAERKLWRSVEPATLPLLYDPDVSATTVVYVPGIYDELFDGEIWSRALSAVRERLGARTLTIPVDGRCSSGINAAAIVSALREDTRRRLERGYERPRYLIIGYSKGGIDATEALVRAPDLARSQVSALVSIASPHRGTTVAERTDVPAAFVKMSVRKPAPAACDSATASESLWPVTRSAFWVSQQNGASLAPLTRYFSLSFVTDAEQAHPWMKVTKQIGQFREPNDGVVPVSSSRFPEGVMATHLGTFEADHIAARLASSFPQDAFLEAVVVTVAELGALRPQGADTWRRMLADRESSIWRGVARYFSDDEPETAPVFASALRQPSPLPGGPTGWAPERVFRMTGAEQFANMQVRPMTPGEHPGGIHFRCDQRNMEDFRREYEFYYDAGNGGAENDVVNGLSVVATDRPESGGRACRLATLGSAIKMTTVAFRFRPADYPSLRMSLRVARNVAGVDPGRSAQGRNDAAFKLWLILRDTRPAAAGRNMLFGYTWTAPDMHGRYTVGDSLFEARSSRRNLLVSTLPEAWLISIGDPRARDAWHTIQRDLTRDLGRAYPGIPVEAIQVVGITIQSDSDESNGRTEVYLESLDIEPRNRSRPIANVRAALRTR